MQIIFKIILVALLFIVSKTNAQNRIGLDTTILVGKDRGVDNKRNFVIDTAGNKYILTPYIGSVTIGSFVMSTNLSSHWEAKAFYLAKYNVNDSLLWAKRVAQCDTFYRANVQVDNNQELVISFLFDGVLHFSNDSLIGGGLNDCAILKLNSNGNEIFNLHIGGVNTQGSASGASVAFDSDNNIYLYGAYHSSNANSQPLIIGNDSLYSNSFDLFVAKYTSNGQPVWAKKYGGGGADVPSAISLYKDKIYLLGTLGAKFNNDFNGSVLNFPQNYLVNGFIAQLDTSGNGIWTRHFGSYSQDLLSGMAPGDIAVSGNRVSYSAGFGGNVTQTFFTQGGVTRQGYASSNFYMASYDTLGNYKWNTASNSTYNASIYSLIIDSNSNTYAVGQQGTFIIFPPNDTIVGYDFKDGLVCSYDSSGNYRYAFKAGGGSTDIINDVAFDPQGRLYVMGATASSPCLMGNDTLYPPIGQSTVFYSRLDSIPIIIDSSVGVRDYMINDNAWSIYPNPTYDKVVVSLPPSLLNREVDINVLNLYGQVLQDIKLGVSHLSTQELDLNAISAGVYFIQIKGEVQRGIKKIIKQ